MLDGLLEEERKTSSRSCPDCAVEVGRPHSVGCDVARCLKTKQQRLTCNCEECGFDIWTGFWPGVKEAYENKLVCFDTATETVVFDLNRLARLRVAGKL